jgi:ABC-type Fe3+/spermidine/putrescine transport system ATPase subunit
MSAPADSIAVRCDGVTKTYGSGDAKVTALRGVDLDVRRGELLMLVGPSGCGKTTLISLIAGILDQDGGLAQSEAAVSENLVALNKALGGGWQAVPLGQS